MAEVRVIEIHENVFAKNDSEAELIRKELEENGTLFLNFMSSPGSGKTTFLINLINRLKDSYNIAEMDVDIESSLDAQRVSDACQVKALQIHNGGLCHIDAEMTHKALKEVDLKGVDLLILENIGNLVCPAEFDTGAHKNVMILSVPEGDDKPLKYPLMFSVSDVVIISKIDTMDFFDFDMDAARERILALNPEARIFALSSKTGQGMEEFISWVKENMKK